MSVLDEHFHLTSRDNYELARLWLRLAIATRYEPASGALENFLMTVGRRSGILPLYRELAATPEGKVRAREIFAKARDRYHPIAQQSVRDLLGEE